MKYTALFSAALLERMIEEGMVSSRQHPTLPLTILNYTAQAQYTGCWNDCTIQCRGLIIDADGEIISRPFPKFFNLAEHAPSEFADHDFLIHEKLDGSLGILYVYDGQKGIATRGSFESLQAIKGTRLLEESDLFVPLDGYTYLFEIVYPENRIVVDYGDLEALIFLCAIHNDSGATVFEFGEPYDWPGQRAERYDSSVDFSLVASELVRENAEGFVLYFPGLNRRVKVKFDEYVRLHRILTNCSSKTIWQVLSSGDSLDLILENVPDEFYSWVRQVESDLTAQFDEIKRDAEAKFNQIVASFGDLATARSWRREFAIEALKHKNNSLIFALLDGKDISEAIWKQIKPSGADNFVTEKEE